MPRRIEIYWLDDPAGPGWVYTVDGSTYDGGAIGTPDDLGPDASPDEVLAALLRGRQALGEPCLTCGQAAPERDQLIMQMVGDGKSNEEIGDALGLTPNHVTKEARRLGIRRPRGRPAK